MLAQGWTASRPLATKQKASQAILEPPHRCTSQICTTYSYYILPHHRRHAPEHVRCFFLVFQYHVLAYCYFSDISAILSARTHRGLLPLCI